MKTLPSSAKSLIALGPEAFRAELRKRAMTSFRAWCVLKGFHPARHHDLLISKLEAVERGEIPRLMVFMPPGSAKSTYASVLFGPWFLGRNPNKNIITASYAQRLSERFGKKCRNIVADEEFREVFGFSLAADSQAKAEWETEKGGEFTATSVGGAVTGRRGDIIIVDDPIKGRKEADSEVVRESTWEWWLSDLRTRLKPGGAIVIIQTRWHEDDLSGRILPADYDGRSGKIKARDGEVWEVVSIRAEAEADDPLGRTPGEFLWPEWFAGGMLEREKTIQGPRNWNALYQQRPAPEDGDFFRREWFRWYDEAPKHLKTYGASDYAVTADGGDYTVHGVCGVDPEDNIYILDWWRAQTTTDEWVEVLLDLAKTWKPLEWAEEQGQILKSVGPFITKRQSDRKVWFYRNQYTSAVDKPTRAQSFRGRAAMGKVYLPRNAPWVAELLRELLTFPTGKNDDQVDVCSLFGRMLDHMSKGHVPEAAKEPKRLVVGQKSTVTVGDAFKLGVGGKPPRI